LWRRLRNNIPTAQLPQVFYVQSKGKDDEESKQTLNPTAVAVGVGVLVLASVALGAWMTKK